MKKLFISLFAALVGTTAYAATNIYVKASSGNDNYNGASWETAFKTLQKAAQVVNPNEETIIYLEPNTTFDTGGQIDFTDNKLLTIIGQNTTLRAAEKPGNEGGEGARILRAGTGCEVTIKGIIFENGRQVGYFPGGAVFFTGEELVIDSCIFKNNEAGSGGGAIASRGKNVIVRNSYFEGNYLFSGYGTGAAIAQCGVQGGEAGSLTVENCTFYKSELEGVGIAISTYDAASQYSNVNSVKVINSIFLENTSKLDNQAAIDVSNSDKASIQLINNTFYKNDGALRVGDIYAEEGGELIMINNLIFANKSGIFGAEGYSVADLRAPIIGYNNIICGGERGVNEFIDDECFNDKKSQYNNTVETTATYPLSRVALATSLSDDNFVPYLELTAENSDAVNTGYASGEYTDLIPQYDITGRPTQGGSRDIGAYEYPFPSAINNVKAPTFKVSQDAENLIINTGSSEVKNLVIMDILGHALYTSDIQNEINIQKSELQTQCAIIIINNGAEIEAQKVILY